MKIMEENNMTTYPNQKIVTVFKAEANKEHTYAVINKDALFRAARELTHNELKVFLYLASNQNEYCLALSTADIAEKMGANKRKIQEAINGLIEKKYIEHMVGNSYDFYEEAEE